MKFLIDNSYVFVLAYVFVRVIEFLFLMDKVVIDSVVEVGRVGNLVVIFYFLGLEIWCIVF